MQVDWDVDAVVVKTRNGLADLEAKTQKRTKTTGCGQGTVFGDLMDEIDSVRLPAGATLTQVDALRAARPRAPARDDLQAGRRGARLRARHQRARPAREILMFVEDVGRHNAVDAIAGQMWLDRIDGGDKIFYTTGRLTSEMVIKAAQMGIPFLVSRSGLTQMGYEIARKGRHHDDRPRDQQALPAVHRRRALPERDADHARRRHRHRARRRPGPAHGRRRQGTGRARRRSRWSRTCSSASRRRSATC